MGLCLQVRHRLLDLFEPKHLIDERSGGLDIVGEDVFRAHYAGDPDEFSAADKLHFLIAGDDQIAIGTDPLHHCRHRRDEAVALRSRAAALQQIGAIII